MNCRQAHLLLEDDATPVQEALAAHLRECPACAEYARQVQSENVLFARVASKLPNEASWRKAKAGIDRALVVAATGNVPVKARPPIFSKGGRVWAFTAAASIAVVVGVWLGVQNYRNAPAAAPVVENRPPGVEGHSPIPSRVQPKAPVAATENRDPFGIGSRTTPPANETQPRVLANGDLAERLQKLQNDIRQQKLLDELQQLEIVFSKSDDADARSVAEDAEFYADRILALDGQDLELTREMLSSIGRGEMLARLKQVQRDFSANAPAAVTNSLDLSVRLFEMATELGHAKELTDAR